MNSELYSSFLTVVSSAITDRRVIQLKHRGAWRTVEPYIVGVDTDTQANSFYGFCRDVTPTAFPEHDNRWQLFRFSEIEALELTYYEFRPHIDYTGNYDRIQSVYTRLNTRLISNP